MTDKIIEAEVEDLTPEQLAADPEAAAVKEPIPDDTDVHVDDEVTLDEDQSPTPIDGLSNTDDDDPALELDPDGDEDVDVEDTDVELDEDEV